MSDSLEPSDLFERTEQTQVEYLRTDLELCHTFVELAKTELTLGERQRSAEVLSKAEQGYASISHLRGQLEDVAHRSEIEEGLKKLRAALDTMATG